MHPRVRTAVGSIAAVVGIAVFVAMRPSGPMAGEPELAGPHVIDYERLGYPGVEVADSHREIRQGFRAPDGSCRYEERATRQPGSAPVREVTLAYDPDACRWLVEVGRPVGDGAVRVRPDEGTARRGSSSALEGPTTSHPSTSEGYPKKAVESH